MTTSHFFHDDDNAHDDNFLSLKEKKTNDNLGIKNKKELKIFELKTLLGTFFACVIMKRHLCW
jgi:hypothetical protein